MGHGTYSLEAAQQLRAGSHSRFAGSGRAGPNPDLDPRGVARECMNETAIVIALDVTRSRGQDSKLMYDELPNFLGQIQAQGYVSGAAFSFCAIGDAASGDVAPIQVGQFEADNRLDRVLENFWIEEGGGGTGQESYELVAYYYARHSVLACLEQGKKGHFFFVGDEGFYPHVDRTLVRRHLGFDLEANIPSADIFRELQGRYETFLIYPQKSWRERVDDIDAEIKQRVVTAGGQYDNVDIRASLVWDDRNDLDLHVIAPSGEEVYYGNPRSGCGGWLDVDMNVRGESTTPVENIRWARGDAPAGKYQVFLRNFAFHGKGKQPSPFRAELEVNGKIEHYEDVISPKGATGERSDILISEFVYDPAERPATEPADPESSAYLGYSDEVILEQWRSVLPTERILLLDDATALVDVVLGALALTGGSADLPGYLATLEARGADQARIDEVAKALAPLGEA